MRSAYVRDVLPLPEFSWMVDNDEIWALIWWQKKVQKEYQNVSKAPFSLQQLSPLQDLRMLEELNNSFKHIQTSWNIGSIHCWNGPPLLTVLICCRATGRRNLWTHRVSCCHECHGWKSFGDLQRKPNKGNNNLSWLSHVSTCQMWCSCGMTCYGSGSKVSHINSNWKDLEGSKRHGVHWEAQR